jgi:hypothetical protein
MRGLVTINKVYKDGKVENVIKDEENTLTQGFSIALTRMLTKGEESDPNDFKFEYFQLGTSSYHEGFMWDESLANATRKNFFKLHSPIRTLDEYGKNSDMEIVYKNTIVAEEQFVESKDLVYIKENQYLAKLGEGKVSMLNYNPVTQADALSESEGLGQVRRTQNSLLIRLRIDEEAANGLDLREFGLFIKDPEEVQGEDNPILAAYKSLSEPIRKTSDFFIDVQWVIELFDIVNNYTALTDCIFFKPAYLERSGTEQRGTFVKDLSAGEYYDIELDSPVPTLTGGSLYYTLFNEGDETDDDEFTYAKRNVHYNLINDQGYGDVNINSPMVWEPGSSRKVLRFFAYPNPNHFRPRIFRIRLDRFEGDKTVPLKRSNNYPRDFIIRINPSQSLSQEVLFDGGVSDYLNGFKKCVVKTEDGSVFHDDLDVILNVESSNSYDLRIDNGPIQNFTESRKHKIPVSKGSSQLEIYLRGTGSLTASLANREGVPYNYADFSNNFEAGLAGSALTTVRVDDVIDHLSDLSTVNSSWFVDNFLGSKEWFDGFPTRNTHDGYDLYPQPPSPDIFVETFRVEGEEGLAPDKLEQGQFSYCHPFLYTWPDREGNIFARNGGRISLGKTHRKVDAVGNSTRGRVNDDRYRPVDETSVFSVYVKKIDSIVDSNKSILDKSGKTYQCSSSEYFSLEETNQGFPDIQTEFDGAGKKVVFRWEPNGGVVAHKCYAKLGLSGGVTFNNDFARRISYTAVAPGSIVPTQNDVGRVLVACDANGNNQVDLGIYAGDQIIDDGTATPQLQGYLHFRSDSTLTQLNNPLINNQTIRVLRVKNANGQGLDPNGLKLNIGLTRCELSEGPFGFIDGLGFQDSGGNSLYAIDCGVFSGTNGGGTNRDEEKYGKTDPLCKNGWYRVWVSCTIPTKLKGGSTESAFSDNLGARHSRAIYPSVGGGESLHAENGLVVFPGDVRNGLEANLGKWRQVPNTDFSSVDGYDLNRTYFSAVDGYEDLYTQPYLSSIPGTFMAYSQYERYSSSQTTDTISDYLPRDYQPRYTAYFHPYGGLRNSNANGAVKELTFNFS